MATSLYNESVNRTSIIVSRVSDSRSNNAERGGGNKVIELLKGSDVEPKKVLKLLSTLPVSKFQNELLGIRSKRKLQATSFWA